MWRHAITMVALFCASSGWSFAQTATTQPAASDARGDEVYEYAGDIGGKLPIGMRLRFDKDGHNASGCYFYYKYCKDIRIDAALNDRAVVIREYDADGKVNGVFVGQFTKTDPRHRFKDKKDLQREVIAGNWSKPDGSAAQPFYLSCEFIAPYAPGKNEYANAGFDEDAAVNRFASNFRQAVLDHNGDKVTSMIQFPIDVFVDGKRQKVSTTQEFRRQYDRIFTADYVKRIGGSAPCHMFSRDQGVMLGNDGEVWISPLNDATDRTPIVIGLNNDQQTH